MSRFRWLFAGLTLLGIAACSGPGRLPLDVKRCDTVIQPHAVTIAALFSNTADKPVTDARLQIDFYHDFKFTRVIGVADFHPQLEPDTQRTVNIVIMNAGDIGGQAQRCDVDHIDYADGTKADVPQ